MKSDSPAFLFYVDRYIGGTMGFSLEQHGAYILLMCYQFNNGHFCEETAVSIAGQTWDSIKKKFTTDADGLWYNDVLEKTIKTRKEYCEKQRQNALSRHGKNDKPLSGHKLSGVPTQSQRKANAGAKLLPNRCTRVRNRNDYVFNTTDATTSATDVIEERFNSFWSKYPKKAGKGDARKAWMKLRPSEELLQKILTALEWQVDSQQWKRKVIPNPATYLNGSRWEDEPSGYESSDAGGNIGYNRQGSRKTATDREQDRGHYHEDIQLKFLN